MSSRYNSHFCSTSVPNDLKSTNLDSTTYYKYTRYKPTYMTNDLTPSDLPGSITYSKGFPKFNGIDDSSFKTIPSNQKGNSILERNISPAHCLCECHSEFYDTTCSCGCHSGSSLICHSPTHFPRHVVYDNFFNDTKMNEYNNLIRENILLKEKLNYEEAMKNKTKIYIDELEKDLNQFKELQKNDNSYDKKRANSAMKIGKNDKYGNMLNKSFEVLNSVGDLNSNDEEIQLKGDPDYYCEKENEYDYLINSQKNFLNYLRDKNKSSNNIFHDKNNSNMPNKIEDTNYQGPQRVNRFNDMQKPSQQSQLQNQQKIRPISGKISNTINLKPRLNIQNKQPINQTAYPQANKQQTTGGINKTSPAGLGKENLTYAEKEFIPLAKQQPKPLPIYLQQNKKSENKPLSKTVSPDVVEQEKDGLSKTVPTQNKQTNEPYHKIPNKNEQQNSKIIPAFQGKVPNQQSNNELMKNIDDFKKIINDRGRPYYSSDNMDYGNEEEGGYTYEIGNYDQFGNSLYDNNAFNNLYDNMPNYDDYVYNRVNDDFNKFDPRQQSNYGQTIPGRFDPNKYYGQDGYPQDYGIDNKQNNILPKDMQGGKGTEGSSGYGKFINESQKVDGNYPNSKESSYIPGKRPYPWRDNIGREDGRYYPKGQGEDKQERRGEGYYPENPDEMNQGKKDGRYFPDGQKRKEDNYPDKEGGINQGKKGDINYPEENKDEKYPQERQYDNQEKEDYYPEDFEENQLNPEGDDYYQPGKGGKKRRRRKGGRIKPSGKTDNKGRPQEDNNNYPQGPNEDGQQIRDDDNYYDNIPENYPQGESQGDTQLVPSHGTTGKGPFPPNQSDSNFDPNKYPQPKIPIDSTNIADSKYPFGDSSKLPINAQSNTNVSNPTFGPDSTMGIQNIPEKEMGDEDNINPDRKDMPEGYEQISLKIVAAKNNKPIIVDNKECESVIVKEKKDNNGNSVFIAPNGSQIKQNELEVIYDDNKKLLVDGKNRPLLGISGIPFLTENKKLLVGDEPISDNKGNQIIGIHVKVKDDLEAIDNTKDDKDKSIRKDSKDNTKKGSKDISRKDSKDNVKKGSKDISRKDSKKSSVKDNKEDNTNKQKKQDEANKNVQKPAEKKEKKKDKKRKPININNNAGNVYVAPEQNQLDSQDLSSGGDAVLDFPMDEALDKNQEEEKKPVKAFLYDLLGNPLLDDKGDPIKVSDLKTMTDPKGKILKDDHGDDIIYGKKKKLINTGISVYVNEKDEPILKNEKFQFVQHGKLLEDEDGKKEGPKDKINKSNISNKSKKSDKKQEGDKVPDKSEVKKDEKKPKKKDHQMKKKKSRVLNYVPNKMNEAMSSSDEEPLLDKNGDLLVTEDNKMIKPKDVKPVVQDNQLLVNSQGNVLAEGPDGNVLEGYMFPLDSDGEIQKDEEGKNILIGPDGEQVGKKEDKKEQPEEEQNPSQEEIAVLEKMGSNTVNEDEEDEGHAGGDDFIMGKKDKDSKKPFGLSHLSKTNAPGKTFKFGVPTFNEGDEDNKKDEDKKQIGSTDKQPKKQENQQDKNDNDNQPGNIPIKRASEKKLTIKPKGDNKNNLKPLIPGSQKPGVNADNVNPAKVPQRPGKVPVSQKNLPQNKLYKEEDEDVLPKPKPKPTKVEKMDSDIEEQASDEEEEQAVPEKDEVIEEDDVLDKFGKPIYDTKGNKLKYKDLKPLQNLNEQVMKNSQGKPIILGKFDNKPITDKLDLDIKTDLDGKPLKDKDGFVFQDKSGTIMGKKKQKKYSPPKNIKPLPGQLINKYGQPLFDMNGRPVRAEDLRPLLGIKKNVMRDQNGNQIILSSDNRPIKDSNIEIQVNDDGTPYIEDECYIFIDTTTGNRMKVPIPKKKKAKTPDKKKLKRNDSDFDPNYEIKGYIFDEDLRKKHKNLPNGLYGSGGFPINPAYKDSKLKGFISTREMIERFGGALPPDYYLCMNSGYYLNPCFACDMDLGHSRSGYSPMTYNPYKFKEERPDVANYVPEYYLKNTFGNTDVNIKTKKSSKKSTNNTLKNSQGNMSGMNKRLRTSYKNGYNNSLINSTNKTKAAKNARYNNINNTANKTKKANNNVKTVKSKTRPKSVNKTKTTYKTKKILVKQN